MGIKESVENRLNALSSRLIDPRCHTFEQNARVAHWGKAAAEKAACYGLLNRWFVRFA